MNELTENQIKGAIEREKVYEQDSKEHPLPPVNDISVRDCDYHKYLGAYSWCNLLDNPCFVGMINGQECDEFNELRREQSDE